MKITQENIDEVLQLLAETPERITAVAQTLTPEQLHAKPDPKTWSINDILAHLRACVDVWVKDIDAMLAQDSPTLRHISPRTYLLKTNYPALDFEPSFQLFIEQRKALLEKLNGLDFADWSRDAEIKGRQHTVFSQARRLAMHEAAHCEQIEMERIKYA
jgi:hypothetical protein